MKGFKTLNSLQGLFPDYDKTPKAVIAAIAYSLALRISGSVDVEDFDTAKEIVSDEWRALYKAGIVPQKPPKE